jgi:hypothetical protein
MNTTHRKSVFTALAAMMLWAAALPMAVAQDRPLGSVVIYPIVFSKDSGSPTSQKTGVNAVREVMQKAGYSLISSTVAANAWRKMGMTMPSTDSPANVTDLVRYGKSIHARYVVTPVFAFHSRSIWVDLGPRTVSTATVDIVITDVEQGKTVYDREDISARSDEKFEIVKAGLDLFLTPLVTVVSGGPKTPHEQRAVQIAVAKALREWVYPGQVPAQ